MKALRILGFFLLTFLLGYSSFGASGAGEYSEATDVLELMDHVTRWSKSLTPVYRQAWEQKFPLTLEDKSLFSQYADIRKQFSEKARVENGHDQDIFGAYPVGYDGFSEAFYSSKSVAEAIRKLTKRGLEPEHKKFLLDFFGRYKKNISEFLKESSHFSVKLLDLNKKWKKAQVDKALKKIIPFVLDKNVSRKFKIVLRPVWWPKNIPPVVDSRGPYIILRYHPLAHTNEWNIRLMANKAVDALLQTQPKNQRSNLTKVFESQCKGRDIELQVALQTLFGEMLPESYENKKSFDLYKNWGSSAFLDVYLKLLFPLMEEELKGRNQFAGRFMTVASDLCRKVNRLSLVP